MTFVSFKHLVQHQLEKTRQELHRLKIHKLFHKCTTSVSIDLESPQSEIGRKDGVWRSLSNTRERCEHDRRAKICRCVKTSPPAHNCTMAAALFAVCRTQHKIHHGCLCLVFSDSLPHHLKVVALVVTHHHGNSRNWNSWLVTNLLSVNQSDISCV